MPEQVAVERKRVVIADDDDDIRGLMTIAASRAGVDIVAAVDNGRAALDAVRSGGVDLAVVSTVDFPYENLLVGLHGSLTPAEMEIPILIA